MSCFHCVWDFNSVLSDKDKILNFTLINDLSSNQAHVVCLSALSTDGSRAEGVLLCVDDLCQASQIHCLFPPTSQGWKPCRHGAESGTAQWECQACSTISGDGIFSDKPRWVAQVQFMESFECYKNTTKYNLKEIQKYNLQERLRLLKSHMPLHSGECFCDGNSSPPVSWRVCQVQLLIWFMFPIESPLSLVQPCASAPFSGTSLALFHAWFIVAVVQSQSCMPSWQGGHCSRAVMTWTIPAFKILCCEMLCFISFSDIPPDHQPYKQRCLTFLLHWGSKWKKLGFEYLFVWTLPWCF